MTSPVQALGARAVGTVEDVSADRISVLLDPDAPQATALNTGSPTGFPRINGYVLVPNEGGATVGVISTVRIERLSYPKRRGTQQDFALIDLPFPGRVITVTPLGTLTTVGRDGILYYEVRRGVDVFASVGDPVLLPSSDQLRAIVEGESRSDRRVLLGHCPTAGRAPVFVDPDKLFGRHLAVLGNTGAGKSCSVAGLIRWSIEAAAAARVKICGRADRPNARFIVLDPNGEYARAFEDIEELRLFRVEPSDGAARQLRVPAWIWTGDEWAAFTGAAPGVQRPILFEALRRLRSPDHGVPDETEAAVRSMIRRYRTRLRVAIAGGDHQTAGRREGVARSLLNLAEDCETMVSRCDREELAALLRGVGEVAVEAEASAQQAGRGKGDGTPWHDDFSETSLQVVLDRLGGAAAELGIGDEDVVVDESTPLYFEVNELARFVEALAADQSGRDVAQFVDTLNLRIRGLLSRGRLATVLRSGEPGEETLENWLTEYVGGDQASNGNVAVVDLSLVPSEVVHVVVSVLGRMIFEAVQRHRRAFGAELPTTLVLEEAHTFVHRDMGGESATAAAHACGRVFERIAREGRKFGLGLVLSSQRPSEISPTVLSQCNTFLLHRIVNDRDQDLLRRLVPDGLGALLRELPSLPTARAILLGWAAPAPVLVEVREIAEAHRPHSPDPAFWKVWTGEEPRHVDWAKVAKSWRGEAAGDEVPESEGFEESDR